MSEYYSISACLVDNQKLPSTFQLDVPNLGHLEGPNERDIKKGTTVELPLWLSSLLAEKEYVNITLPPYYSTRVRHALAASALAVNLRKLGGSGWFFAFGGKLTDELVDDLPLQNILKDSFQARMTEVMDQAQHSFSSSHSTRSQSSAAKALGDALGYMVQGSGMGIEIEDPKAKEFLEGIDEWEKELFAVGQISTKAMRVWTDQKTR